MMGLGGTQVTNEGPSPILWGNETPPFVKIQVEGKNPAAWGKSLLGR